MLRQPSLAMDELTINLSPKRVDYRYLKVLIVGEAVVAKMLSQLFAVLYSLLVTFKIDPDPVSQRDAILHIEKELLHDESGLTWAAVNRATRANHPHAKRFQLGAPFASWHRAQGRAGALLPLHSVVRHVAPSDPLSAA